MGILAQQYPDHGLSRRPQPLRVLVDALHHDDAARQRRQQPAPRRRAARLPRLETQAEYRVSLKK